MRLVLQSEQVYCVFVELRFGDGSLEFPLQMIMHQLLTCIRLVDCLSVVLRHTREFFTYMLMSP